MVHPPPDVGNAKRYIGRLSAGLAGLPDSTARNWQKTDNAASIGFQETINAKGIKGAGGEAPP